MASTPRRARTDAHPVVTVQRAGRVVLPRGAAINRWVRAATGRATGAVTVRLTGRAESARLNLQYRGKPAATNVLAFPAGVRGELGDLVICLPVVRREAAAQGKTAREHLAHLVVHGTLHLLGHDHERPASARRMECREVRILAGLGIPDPYRPRTGRRKH
jgi:probable rRNA maturation factor